MGVSNLPLFRCDIALLNLTFSSLPSRTDLCTGWDLDTYIHRCRLACIQGIPRIRSKLLPYCHPELPPRTQNEFEEAAMARRFPKLPGIYCSQDSRTFASSCVLRPADIAIFSTKRDRNP
jgi:hypothetical protein